VVAVSDNKDNNDNNEGWEEAVKIAKINITRVIS